MRFSPDPVRNPRSAATPNSPSRAKSYASFRAPNNDSDSDEDNDHNTQLDYNTSDSEENNPLYAVGRKSEKSISQFQNEQEEEMSHIFNLTSHVDTWVLYTSTMEASWKVAERRSVKAWQDHLIKVQQKKLLGEKRRRQELEHDAEERDADLKSQQEALDHARRQQEEQERIAREKKEAEERKIKAERERNEKERSEKEKERNEKEKQERLERTKRDAAKAAADKQQAKQAATAADSVSPKAAIEAQKYRDHLQVNKYHSFARHITMLQRRAARFPNVISSSKICDTLFKNIRTKILPAVAANKVWKDYCFKIRFQIKPKIGQIVNQRAGLLKIVNELDTIFTQAKGVSDVVGEWSMNFTAKSFVKQAEMEVTVNMPTAYPLAHVCVLLFQRHPTFLDSLMARFVKKCTYVIPQYMDKQPGQTAQDVLKAKGYKQKGENDWENNIQYSERMCGILALWAAILQTTPEVHPGRNISVLLIHSSHFRLSFTSIVGQNLYGISHGWTWLARIVSGTVLLQTYPRQLPKVLLLLMQQYIPLLAGNKEAIASVVRLRNYLEEYGRSEGRTLKGVEGRTYDP
ncbi:GLE1-like protein-domain-containing protein [Jimgerdemannia flammicorona]|uniref:mRNA export factor GLE1 n=1 Tax=Jimgerdemannia flammicorona TaxID=994334 RepID=A0A433DCH7_9FUNG|nr:GLE1-like protein-domain-containing protein [Jimgerdemannia flammicorona]